MKKVFFGLIFGFSLLWSQVIPIANHQLDECSWDGTNGEVKDSSTNSYNLTMIGSISTESNDTAQGGIANVGKFDGNGYLELDNTNELNLDNNFTITAWIKTTQDYGVIVSKADNNSPWNGYILSVGGYGKSKQLAFWMGNGSGTRNWYFSGVNVNDGDWHYVGVSIIGNTIKFYVDNALVKTQTFAGGDVKTSIEPFRIGRFVSDSTHVARFNGNIDEVKVFDEALSDSEMEQVYNNENIKKNFNGNPRSARTCPTLEYRFEECLWSGIEGEVDNFGDSQYNATAKADAITQSGSGGGIFRVAKLLNDNDYIEVKNTPNFSSYTFSSWVKAPNGNYHPIFVKGEDIEIYIGNGLTVAHNRGTSGSFDYKYFSNPPDDSWFLLTVTYDVDSKVLEVYYDGVSQGQDNNFKEPLNKANGIYLGKVTAFGTHYLNGYLDEVKMFDKALSSIEVQSIFNNEKVGKSWDGNTRTFVSCAVPDPIANHQLDECSWDGTNGEVKDSSTNNYNLTMIGSISTESNDTAQGGIANVGKFDGNGYLELDNTNELNLDNNFTITAWIKTTQDYGVIVSKADNNSPWNGYILSVGGYGKSKQLAFWMGNGSGTRNWYFSGVNVNDGDWHYVGVSIIGNTIKFYVDNALVKTQTFAGGDVKTSIEPFRIGRFVSDSTHVARFNGNIDEVKVFDEALDKNVMSLIYNNELVKRNYDGSQRSIVCLKPIVNYRLDDLCNSGGSGFLVAESELGLDGTIKPDGDALVAKKAKVCTGAEFNGDDQYIDINDSSVLDNTNKLTTMAWIYPEQLRQTNGTNARGVFSKRKHYAGDSQYAYGVFFWNGYGQTSDSAQVYVDIVSSNNRTHSNRYIKEKEWTHLAVVFDGELPVNERLKIYINGQLDSTHREDSSSIPDFSSNFYIGNLYTGPNELKVFKGIMDEVKIYDKALSLEEIKTTYDYENIGLDYLGLVVNCTCSVDDINATLNVVDRVNGCFNWENNITTKVVNQDIKLVVLAKDDNGTAVSDVNITRVELLNYTDLACSVLKSSVDVWLGSEKTDTNGCFNILDFQYNKSTRCAKMRVYGSVNNIDINGTSNDEFAIRPENFNMILPSTNIYAGENFNITFTADSALDYNETRDISFSIEANETKVDCITGSLNVPLFSFENGSKVVDVNYSEVGDINITIQEINGSEFAYVDFNDTNESQRFITPSSTTITILPHHFKVNATLKNKYSDFTYLSQDLNMSAILDINITAKNKQNETTQNYNSACYAKNIDINISHNNIEDSGLSKILYINQNDLDENSSLNDVNKSKDINITSYLKENFTTDHNGTTLLKVFINFDRNSSKTVNPFDLNITDINVSDENDTFGTTTPDKNATFYYGRVKTKDITTNKKDVNNSLHVEVYSDSKNAYVNDFHQESLSWYIMEDDNNQIVTSADLNDSENFNDSTENTTLNIPPSTYSNGVLHFNIENLNSIKVKKAYIHVKIPSYLWYSKYYDYNTTGDCSKHPCFIYTYQLQNNKKNISSGTFTGSSIGDEYNATKVKRGVKVFR